MKKKMFNESEAQGDQMAKANWKEMAF